MRKTPPTSITTGQQMQAPSASPLFVGGGYIPLLVKQFEGINSTQATSGTSEAAIATDLSYVMEGTDHAIAIYSAASGAKLYGPYSPDSFFAPIKHAGYTFAYPQLYYDTMRDRWIVLYLEIAPGGTVTYLDLAISQTTSPTQPTPGAQYNLYQFSANFAPSGGVNSFCAYETLGVDYYGVYITCTNYRQGSFVGNTVLAINKAPMLSEATPNTWSWNNAVASSVGPSLVLSPATEEGVQDAEFIVGTDAGPWHYEPLPLSLRTDQPAQYRRRGAHLQLSDRTTAHLLLRSTPSASARWPEHEFPRLWDQAGELQGGSPLPRLDQRNHHIRTTRRHRLGGDPALSE
jgi:hypothetical protein